MKVLQIGMGGMGNAWIKAVAQVDTIEHIAFVEINDDVIAEQSAAYGFTRDMVYSTLTEALAVVRPDAILDITPPRFRRENAMIALQAGIPVLSEKPLAETRADAEAIVAEARRTGVLYAVAQNYRYREAVQTLRTLVAEKTYGNVGSITLNFYKGLYHTGFRNTMPYPLTIDMSIHHYDMLRFVLGADPVALSAHSWHPAGSTYLNPAAAAVFMRFANEVAVNYTGSWASFGMETDWNGDWRLDCSGGVIRMSQGEVSVQTVIGQGKHIFHDYNEPEVIPLQKMAHEDQVYLLHELHDAVMHGTPMQTTCEDNIHSINMVFDTIDAIESGQTITKKAVI